MRPLLLLFILPLSIFAQTSHTFPQQEINRALLKASQDTSLHIPAISTTTHVAGGYQSGIGTYIKNYWHQITTPGLPQSPVSRSSDTLWVGLTPNDTVRITGTWQNPGPIAVVNNGVLLINNAYATIGGNIFIVGNGQLYAQNSTLYVPQQYFYQYQMILSDNAIVKIADCTVDFGGLAHGLIISNLSTLTMQNVNQSGGATTGMEGGATFNVDTSTTLGEIVIIDSVHLNLYNVDTVLLWHQVPKGAGLTWTFPDGVNLQHYAIGPDSAGVSGLKYTVEVDNCKLAHWAVMPEDHSNVNISNTSLWSVGVLFSGTDTANVSGIVDSSFYASSSGLFNDRTFQLTNTSVYCWGLYSSDNSVVNVSDCIVGEIGSHNKSNINSNSVFCDGTGGYFWTTDTATEMAIKSSFTCNVRSEGNGVAVVGFGNIWIGGQASAIDKSILLLVQTPVTQQPIAYDGSDVWVALIEPESGYAGDTVLISGSAEILRGPTSNLMSFSSYYLQYQLMGADTFTTIPGVFTTPVYQNVLAPWPTAGLATGSYNVQLSLIDNQGDTTNVSTSITLQTPPPLGIKNVPDEAIRIYPNPTSDQLTISNATPNTDYIAQVFDISGQLAATYKVNGTDNNIPVGNLSSGSYIIKLTGNQNTIVKRFIKM